MTEALIYQQNKHKICSIASRRIMFIKKNKTENKKAVGSPDKRNIHRKESQMN